jgi:ribose transport system ATP-binding protein
MSAQRLSVQNVSVRFGNTIALQDVSFDLHEGEVLALIGENGAGKSTLMKVLSGAVIPQSGTMKLNGEHYQPGDPHAARELGVAMIYQELSLAPTLSVRDNIFLGMEVTRNGMLDYGTMQKRAAAAIAELGHDISLNTPVRDLSISDQQLVELARATAVGCKVLILDEPTSSITKQDVERLFALIKRMKEAGMSVVYISHFLEEVQQIADRFVVLRDGRTVGGGDMQRTSIAEIISLMVGRELADLYPHSARTAGEVALSVNSMAAGTKLERGSFDLHRGEVLGIFGLVGSGRTELLRAIYGLDKVRNGEVRVGTLAGTGSPDRLWKEGVGIVSEDRKNEGLAVNRSIAENLILSRPEKIERGVVLAPAAVHATGAEWIERMRIRCAGPKQKVSELSGGNQQKIAVGRLLYHEVDVLLLDEPTRGIDVGSKQQIYQLIDQLASQNKAVVIISSYLPELMGICDRIAVMCRGVLGPPRAVPELDEHAIMLEATSTGACP